MCELILLTKHCLTIGEINRMYGIIPKYIDAMLWKNIFYIQLTDTLDNMVFLHKL